MVWNNRAPIDHEHKTVDFLSSIVVSTDSPTILLFANFLHSGPKSLPAFDISIDGGPAWSLGADSMVFARLEPGPHQVRATAVDGQVAEAKASLSQDRAAQSKGRLWWCLLAGRRAGRLTLVQPTAPQCKQIADAEPD